jgi:hypothetical protein
VKTVVWTANPYSTVNGYSSPVNLYGSRISLNKDGNLVLTDTNGSTVWESKTTSGKNTNVSLLDTGNLVIIDSGNKTVWQSFDSPTDTLLPGQNLKKDTRLVSGYHYLYFDNDNVLRLLYDGPEITSIYWYLKIFNKKPYASIDAEAGTPFSKKNLLAKSICKYTTGKWTQ